MLELTDGLGVDYAFDVVGHPDTILEAVMAIKRGGTAVAVGVPAFGVEWTLPGALFAIEERSIVGSLFGSSYMPDDIPRLVELYRKKQLELDGLVSREIGLESINEGLDALRAGSGLRSVIRY